MCGVIGVSLERVTKSQLRIVKSVMRETQIRGMHASGVVFHDGVSLTRLLAGVPISQMSEELLDWDEMVNAGDLKMIAHARYSTSDLEYHQPLGDGRLFMAHNGVITQEPPETWKETYGYDFDTRNDSEILLNKIITGHTPNDCATGLTGSSIAVVTIDRDGVVDGWRNNLRPLWRTDFPNGFIITSTKDIMVRASGGLCNPVILKPVGEGQDYQIR